MRGLIIQLVIFITPGRINLIGPRRIAFVRLSQSPELDLEGRLGKIYGMIDSGHLRLQVNSELGALGYSDPPRQAGRDTPSLGFPPGDLVVTRRLAPAAKFLSQGVRMYREVFVAVALVVGG